MKFNFEKNLQHQTQAVESTVGVFTDLAIETANDIDKQFINPVFDIANQFQYSSNIRRIQGINSIENKADGRSNIIDIMMETGTGKTYTYTKTIFELNKQYGIFKFIIVVPTVPIKAGTIDFIDSPSARNHFKEQYGKTITLHEVKSKKSAKNKKSFMPPAVSSFVTAEIFDKNTIQVLLINAGMINADKTMQKSFDKNLLDKYSVPLEAIAATKSFMIIDEPHKFKKDNKSWAKIQAMQPQFIIRYGATFPTKETKKKNGLGKTVTIKEKDYHNLIYTLSAVDSFNRNLIKGLIGHITDFDDGKNTSVKFVSSDGREAKFSKETKDGREVRKELFKLGKNQNFAEVHKDMMDLTIEKLNKSTVELSNGLELKIGDKINPFSYAQTLQKGMIQKTIQHHFEVERECLTRKVKIKPLTLFFIDNIEEYRSPDGATREIVEECIKGEITERLKTEQNEFYKAHLANALKNVSKTHGGYFSKDNNNTDEAIEAELTEILHNKQAILDLDNPRRFVFSKWTLREGWDNPNVFQICKLRSSGSEISKLQEVGRGLRLPLNQYGNRVKAEQFYLHYFVDFTESDFVEKLVGEINEKSGAISIEDIPENLHENMLKQICEKYGLKKLRLLNTLSENNIIDDDLNFINDGFDYIKTNYPLIFTGINSNKVRKATDIKKKITIRTDKYPELKALWEKINEKVVLEYKIDNENEFKEFFIDFITNYDPFSAAAHGLQQRTETVVIENKRAVIEDESTLYGNANIALSTMRYDDFLRQFSEALHINLKTLHQCFSNAKINIDINKYLNQTTIRILKEKFNNYLTDQAMSNFKIEYKKIESSIHPTKITDSKGKLLNKIDATDVGVCYSAEPVADKYLFEELFYDSELEKDNIKTNIKEVIVFTKIPKNSIKIPVAGGKSYSPDFAYVVKHTNGQQKIHFIIETKNLDKRDLRSVEKQKIKHAEEFFGNNITVTFKTQFSNQKITQLIRVITNIAE